MTWQKAYMDQWFHLYVEWRLQTSSNGSYKLKGKNVLFFLLLFFTLMMTLTRLWNLFCPDDDLPKTIIGRKEGRKRQTHVSSHAPCVWPDPSIHHTPSGWYSYILLGCSLATKTHLQNCTIVSIASACMEQTINSPLVNWITYVGKENRWAPLHPSTYLTAHQFVTRVITYECQSQLAKHHTWAHMKAGHIPPRDTCFLGLFSSCTPHQSIYQILFILYSSTIPWVICNTVGHVGNCT